MINEHMKRCSAPSAIRKVEIIPTVRQHLTPTRMTGIKIISVDQDGKELESSYIAGGTIK